MKKAKDILINVLGGIHVEGETYVSFFDNWEKIAGTDIANHSRLSDLNNGILYIEVDHPGWTQLIQLKKREILKKTGSMFPQLKVKDLRVFLEKHKKSAPQSDVKPEDISEEEEKLQFKELLEKLGHTLKRDDELTQ